MEQEWKLISEILCPVCISVIDPDCNKCHGKGFLIKVFIGRPYREEKKDNDQTS